MGLIESMKSAIKGTSNWLRGKLSKTQPKIEGYDPIAGNTTANRRALRLSSQRYSHVSVPMIRNPAFDLISAELGEGGARGMGLTPFVRDVAQMPFGKGITLNKGIQAAKRLARQLGEFNGMNRKTRDKWAYDEAKRLKSC